MSKDIKMNLVFQDGSEVSASQLQMLAGFILNCNRKRSEFLPQIQWGERAWDMLLELYLLSARKSYITFDDIEKEGAMAPSIDKRYFSMLLEEDLLKECVSENDNGPKQYRLSEDASGEVERWLVDCLHSGM